MHHDRTADRVEKGASVDISTHKSLGLCAFNQPDINATHGPAVVAFNLIDEIGAVVEFGGQSGKSREVGGFGLNGDHHGDQIGEYVGEWFVLVEEARLIGRAEDGVLDEREFRPPVVVDERTRHRGVSRDFGYGDVVISLRNEQFSRNRQYTVAPTRVFGSPSGSASRLGYHRDLHAGHGRDCEHHLAGPGLAVGEGLVRDRTVVEREAVRNNLLGAQALMLHHRDQGAKLLLY